MTKWSSTNDASNNDKFSTPPHTPPIPSPSLSLPPLVHHFLPSNPTASFPLPPPTSPPTPTAHLPSRPFSLPFHAEVVCELTKSYSTKLVEKSLKPQNSPVNWLTKSVNSPDGNYRLRRIFFITDAIRIQWKTFPSHAIANIFNYRDNKSGKI